MNSVLRVSRYNPVHLPKPHPYQGLDENRHRGLQSKFVFAGLD